MNIEVDGEVWRRARVHAALGEPVRLAVVDALAMGDAAPSELQELLGVPSNLLAHHLQILQRAGVVERSRSKGDRRRRYLRLAGGAIAGLGWLPTITAAQVIFVCTHNSARSQLAAAIWRQRSDVPSVSAGTHPADRVHPGAVAAARRRGLAMRGSRPARLAAVADEADLVVAVCDNAHEELPDSTPRLHWSVSDPAHEGTPDAFDRAIDELTERIDRIAPHVRPA